MFWSHKEAAVLLDRAEPLGPMRLSTALRCSVSTRHWLHRPVHWNRARDPVGLSRAWPEFTFSLESLSLMTQCETVTSQRSVKLEKLELQGTKLKLMQIYETPLLLFFFYFIYPAQYQISKINIVIKNIVFLFLSIGWFVWISHKVWDGV